MPEQPLRILVIGAHPDDCDVKAAGVAALYRSRGDMVRFVSVTNGESGHHEIAPEKLIDIRRREAAGAAEILDIEYDVLDYRDGRLMPTLDARLELIGVIRQFRPDLVLTHRPNDYHPDHRYTAQLVCDAAYMVTVPAVASDVPPLQRDPVIMYLSDDFTRPYPFTPTVAVDIEPVLETVVDALHRHSSQFYEWLPHNRGYADEVPEHPDDRRKWLGEKFRRRIAPRAEMHRELLRSLYGDERGSAIRYVEAFEPCEYGAPLDPSSRRRLFPFLPQVSEY